MAGSQDSKSGNPLSHSTSPTKEWSQYLAAMETFNMNFSGKYVKSPNQLKNNEDIGKENKMSELPSKLILPPTNQLEKENENAQEPVDPQPPVSVTQNNADDNLSVAASDDHSLHQPDTPYRSEKPSPSDQEVQPAESKSPAAYNTMKEESSSTDSNGSDEVVFRQDEHNMVGPRVNASAFKHGRARVIPSTPISPPEENVADKSSSPQGGGSNRPTSSRTPAGNSAVPNPNGRAPNGSGPQNQVASTAKTRAPTGENKTKIAKAVNTKEELKKLQQEAMIKFGKKELGIATDDSPHTGNLFQARQGPGTDPMSPVFQELMNHLLTGAGSNLIQDTDTSKTNGDVALASDQNNKDTELQTVDPTRDVVGGGLEIKRWGDFSPIVVDWQYRRWETEGDREHFTRFFRTWLENTMRLGYLVDKTDEGFLSGEWHADGCRGLVAPDFEVDDEAELDPSDPENDAHRHETASGYAYNWNLQIENAEKEKQEQKRIARIPAVTVAEPPPPHPYAPKVNMYVRPVENKDIPALVALFNWYVRNTFRCVDLKETTQDSMKMEIDEVEKEGFPFLVAAEQKTSIGLAMNEEEEMVYGYGLVCDFTGRDSTQRYSGEIEIFVHPKNYRLGIGRCLLDKIVEICDPQYPAKHGYHFDCAPEKRQVYCGGGSRPVTRLITVIHFAADDTEDYEWIKAWLEKEFEFEQQALLKGVGIKKKQLLNSGYLVHNTSVSI